MQKLILKYFFLLLVIINVGSCSFNNSTNSESHSKFNKTAAQILGDSNYLALCYGGYRTNSRDTQPTLTQLQEDLRIMHAMGIKILRTYNTKYAEIDNLLKAITSLKMDDPTFEMYVMLGAWIDCENAWTNAEPNHDKQNELANTEEIARAVQLANQYPAIVKVISVGNEAMVKWAVSYYVSPNIILKWVNHLQQLKAVNGLPKDLWITSSDNFASWGGGDSSYYVEDLKKLYQAVDYVSIHTYPMHDTYYNPIFWGVQSNEIALGKLEKIDSLMVRSVNYAKKQYQNVFAYMQSIGEKKPIHIGETGWASHSVGFYGKEGSKACDEYKSARYYQLMREWTNKERITCFYFEAFDEKWKDAKNPNGSENHFGLFTIEGKAKYALWGLLDQGVFKNLTRDGRSIEKTYEGSEEELLNSVELPQGKK
jgi:exo-beta-1,3-glucanase (GH17 family)